MFQLFKLLVASKIKALSTFIGKCRDVLEIPFAILVILILVIIIIATFPISIPVLIYLDRKENKKGRERGWAYQPNIFGDSGNGKLPY